MSPKAGSSPSLRFDKSIFSNPHKLRLKVRGDFGDIPFAQHRHPILKSLCLSRDGISGTGLMGSLSEAPWLTSQQNRAPYQNLLDSRKIILKILTLVKYSHFESNYTCISMPGTNR